MDKIKFSSTIAGASIIITLSTLASKGLGFFREILFANYFGLGNEFDIYLVGAALPITINTIVFFIAQNYLIPIYHKKKSAQSVEAADDFIKLNIIIFFVFSLLFSLILYAFSNYIIKGYLGEVTPGVFSTARNVLLLFLITIPLQTTFAVFANYLIAKFEYKHPALSNIIVNLFVIIIIILTHKNLGIYSIAVGFIGGFILQLIYIVAFSKIQLRFKNISIYNLSYKNIDSTFYLIIIIEAITQLFILIDRYFYTQVEPGGISAINYATTLYLLPISILAAGLSTALFPKFASAFSARNHTLLASYFKDGLANNLFLFIPVAVFLFFNSDLIVSVVYQRGQFTQANTTVTGDLLKIFAVSLVFYSTYAIINKFLYATDLLNKLVYISIAALVIKIFLNFILVGSYMQNGLAWASTISYSSMGILGIIFSVKIVRQKISLEIIKYFLIFTFTSFFCFGITSLSFSFLDMNNITKIIIEPVVFGFLFISSTMILGFNELASLKKITHSLQTIIGYF